MKYFVFPGFDFGSALPFGKFAERGSHERGTAASGAGRGGQLIQEPQRWLINSNGNSFHDMDYMGRDSVHSRSSSVMVPWPR
jgi:hypothetical protein